MSTSEVRLTRAGRVAGVIRAVCAAAVRDSGAAGIVVLEDWTPEGELLYEWLVQELGEAQVWRAASLAKNVHEDNGGGLVPWRVPPADAPLVAHPASKTTLLLSGRLPLADLLPLGDLWASQLGILAGRWSAPPDLEAAIGEMGGIDIVDEALARLVEARYDPSSAVQRLAPAAAERLLSLYERGRYARLRPRLVPKLTTRTLGIDLFD
ncbi:hypothetical protein BH23GEM9_BH23GEM9_03000 [soil metagenome]